MSRGSHGATALEAAPVTGRIREAGSRPPVKPGFWARLARAFTTARMRQAQLEVASFLARHDDILRAERLILDIDTQPRR
ncbi:MAG: hypothetical protein ACHQAY_26530 [Hyphomicrobiales bacterium]